MKPRHKRLAAIIGGVALLGAAIGLVLYAFQSNLVFFFSPTEVAAPAGEGVENTVALLDEAAGAVTVLTHARHNTAAEVAAALPIRSTSTTSTKPKEWSPCSIAAATPT